MGRPFARVRRGDAAPAACVRDGRTNDLIDLGAEPIPGYGVVYVCMICVGELAGALGLVPNDVLEQRERAHTAELAAVRASTETPTGDTAETQRALEFYRGSRHLLDRAGSGVPAAGDPAGVPVPAPDEADAGDDGDRPGIGAIFAAVGGQAADGDEGHPGDDGVGDAGPDGGDVAGGVDAVDPGDGSDDDEIGGWLASLGDADAGDDPVPVSNAGD